MDYDIHKVGGILIRDRKLLVEKSFNKDFYLAPGGKVEVGETPIKALVRELHEEFGILVAPKDIEEFGTFYADAAGQDSKIIRMDVFMVNQWQGEPQPNSEVEIVRWINSDEAQTLAVGSVIAHEIIPRLKQQNIID
jgi:8-oxo-dGTP diphosphatase